MRKITQKPVEKIYRHCALNARFEFVQQIQINRDNAKNKRCCFVRNAYKMVNFSDGKA